MKEKTVADSEIDGMTPHQKDFQETAQRLKDSRASTTVAKAAFILEILASRADTGISQSELTALIKLPKSSTFRYLVTLEELGLAERKDGDRFCLGAKVIEMAGNYFAKSDIRNESLPVMNDLAEITGETIHLAIPFGSEVVYIAKIESRHTLAMASYIGSRLPMYCTALGKAILAYSSPSLIESILSGELKALTNHTIVSKAILNSELVTVRSRGYAIDNQENEYGICCVGAPILDFSKKAIGAVSISGPLDRLSVERANEFGPLLRERILKISRRWGYVG
jgi:IclR family acetate operon transcriptional repressor